MAGKSKTDTAEDLARYLETDFPTRKDGRTFEVSRTGDLITLAPMVRRPFLIRWLGSNSFETSRLVDGQPIELIRVDRLGLEEQLENWRKTDLNA